MLDLKKMARMLDEALEQETAESLRKWIFDRREEVSYKTKSKGYYNPNFENFIVLEPVKGLDYYSERENWTNVDIGTIEKLDLSQAIVKPKKAIVDTMAFLN